MRIRLLAIDLDGTLVNDRLEMDPRDVAAVKAASAAGVTVVLATGRMFKSSLRYAQPLGLTGPIINYQGAVVRDIASGEVWYRCELTVPMQQRVLAIAEPRDWHVNAYVDEGVYTARARPEADLYARIAMVPYEMVGPLSKWVSQDSTKMVLVDLDPANVPARMAELSAWMGELAWAGFGVAMGNAPEALKAVAKHVTGRIGEAGVARVIERFVIGKEEAQIRV